MALDDPEEIAKKKEEMRRFVKADRKMRREAKSSRSSGCLMSFLKFSLVIGVFVAIGYGIYLWHPWGWESTTVERSDASCSGRLYETTTTLTVLGIGVRETHSTVCVEDD